MEKEIYTKEEKLLLSIGKLAQAMELDLMLLKMEEQVGLMDGLPVVKEEQQ